MKSILKQDIMPENEFEKQVHDELQDFHLRPSEEVWEKVEAAIREKKKRRPLVWLLLPLVLGGGLLILLLENGKKNSADTVVQQDKQPISTPPDVNEKSNADINDKKTVDRGISEKEMTIKEKPAGKDDVTSAKVIESKTRKALIKKNQHPVRHPYANNEDDLLPAENLQKDFDIETNTRLFDAPLPAAEKMAPGSTKQMNGGLQQNLLPGEEIKKLMDSLMRTSFVSSPRRNNKWEWGIALKSGFSNNSENIFRILEEEKADNLYSSPNAGSGGQSMIPPSGTEAAFSFGAGVQVKRHIGNSTSLSLGLQYAQYSNTRKTGIRVDSLRTVNNNFSSFATEYFYRTGTVSEFRSSYHFLEMPIHVQWKLNPRGKLPVSPEIGLRLVRLLSSDGLVYSDNQHFYYSDKGLINKTQLHAAAGISFELFKRSRHPLTFGPYLQFGLSPHYKKEYGSRERIGFGGVHAVWTAKKK